MHGVNVLARTFDYGRDVGIVIVNNIGEVESSAQVEKDGRLRFEKRKDFEERATIIITTDMAKKLVNRLFDIGIRPDKVPAVENELTATKYHLEDMRRMVFADISPLPIK